MRRLILGVVLMTAACDGPTNSPTGITSVDAPRLNASNENGVVQSASGGAQRFSAGQFFILSFQANKHADGSVSGRYHVDAKAADAKFDVVVTCLSVVDNRAWIGGIIQNSSNPIVRDGSVSYFYVVDNGAGANGGVNPPDVVSALRLNDAVGEDLRFCAERPLALPSRAIDDGNIRVDG
jgi:hypothetical protein